MEILVINLKEIKLNIFFYNSIAVFTIFIFNNEG